MANSNGSIGNIRKKFHETHELISTSYHESGHTIYGLIHNINISQVTVFEDKKSKRIHGFTYYNSIAPLTEIEDNELFNNRLFSEIGLSYAGLVAEKRYFKIISGSDKFPMFLREGSSHDFSEAASIFEKYNLSEPGRKRYNHKQKIIKSIDKEMQEHWDAVTIIAHSLFKKKKLSFIEIKELLIKKSDKKDFWKKKFKIIDQLYNNSEVLDENYIKHTMGL
jgi:ATP-dependent Zn protease